ncbi:GAF and ANTAR domain-containing protein [Nonomuraea basaltis]|uniref:GAF and ANTAR domain-containing protein n=1 Tax=Nonomuraea basaltis TaxID=2495887 RepID=UPI00110C581C|nr:GAF and ANTAR domain-containing protein [Nonomuraea basaltis]TMR88378.1 GAF and ANTAR domain-containing protein [Nonomuraea basaltis]
MNRPGAHTDIEEFERALAECVAIATRAMPDSPMVSIALCAENGLRTVACSHARAELLDGLQSAAEQGPCIDALDTGEPVTATDLGEDSRWPRFAAESGLFSVHSEPLKSDGGLLGVLTLYSDRSGGFSEETRVAVRVTAGHIGLLFRTALDAARMREVAAQLKEALTTRAIIDQALGIIMAQRRCTSHQAFEVLRHVSQDKNVKLHQVAATIVEKVTGEPPQRSRFEDPPPRRAGQA